MTKRPSARARTDAFGSASRTDPTALPGIGADGSGICAVLCAKCRIESILFPCAPISMQISSKNEKTNPLSLKGSIKRGIMHFADNRQRLRKFFDKIDKSDGFVLRIK